MEPTKIPVGFENTNQMKNPITISFVQLRDSQDSMQRSRIA